MRLIQENKTQKGTEQGKTEDNLREDVQEKKAKTARTGNRQGKADDSKRKIKQEETTQRETGYRNICDRIFKRIFSLSDRAIISLINGLFGKNFPTDSNVAFHNVEFVRADLKGRLADVYVTIAGRHTFHLEAQMQSSDRVVLRVFEYGFLHAMATQPDEDTLDFPEPVVVYLDRKRGIAEESVLHINFKGQGCFDYRVKNFLYLAHDIEELDRRQLVLLIPFQLLRLRRLLDNGMRAQKEAQKQDLSRIQQLQEEIIRDIIGSINKNLSAGSLTEDDARQLLELTDLLQEHICEEFKKKGGEAEMKPLLPGAIELPNDKYRLRISQLEDELGQYKKENIQYKNENIQYKNENIQYKNENVQYKDTVRKLEERIQELLKKNP